MKVFRKIVQVIFIWFLMIIILFLICSHIFSKTILNQDYILGQLEKENYYNNVYHEIQSSFEGYIGPSGLDESIFFFFFSEEQIKQDIIQIVNHIYTGEDYTIQTEEMREKLNRNIYESLLNYNVSEEEKVSISHFEEEIIKEYQEQVTHSEYFEILEGIFPKIIQKLPALQLTFGLVGIIVIGILFVINKKMILCSISDSLLASSLFLLFTKLWISSEIEIANITILNDAFSKIISNVLKDILDNWNIVAIVGIIISILCLIGSYFFFYRDKKQIKATKNS